LKERNRSEIGSQGVVSEILTGKRELKFRQVRAQHSARAGVEQAFRRFGSALFYNSPVKTGVDTSEKQRIVEQFLDRLNKDNKDRSTSLRKPPFFRNEMACA
jgi:hypothetical protein